MFTDIILKIVKKYRKFGLQYVPVKIRGGVKLTTKDGKRRAIFSCSKATKNGHKSPTKFLVWIHWEDSGKVVRSNDFKLFI
jgi:hypothetical protein